MNRRLIIPLVALALSAVTACTPEQIQDAIDLDAQRRAPVDVTPTLPPPAATSALDCTQPIPVDGTYVGRMGVYIVVGVGVFLNSTYAPNCPTIPTPDELPASRPRRGR